MRGKINFFEQLTAQQHKSSSIEIQKKADTSTGLVTVYVWETNTAALAVKNLARSTNLTRAVAKNFGASLSIINDLGHVSIDIDGEYFSIWATQKPGEPKMAHPIENLEKDKKMAERKHDHEFVISGLNTAKMKIEAKNLLDSCRKNTVKFKATKIWFNGKLDELNCAISVQHLLNIGDIDKLIPPQKIVDTHSGAQYGAVIGGVVAPVIAALTAINYSKTIIGAGVAFISLFGGTVATSGTIGWLVVRLLTMNPMLSLPTAALLGAINGGVTGKIIENALASNDIEKHLAITPTEVGKLAKIAEHQSSKMLPIEMCTPSKIQTLQTQLGLK